MASTWLHRVDHRYAHNWCKTTFSDIRRVFLPVDVILRAEGQSQGGRGVNVTRRKPATGTATNSTELQNTEENFYMGWWINYKMIIDMYYFWPDLSKVYCLCVDRRWSSSSIQNWPWRSCIGHRTNCQKRWGRNLNPHHSQRASIFTYQVSRGRTVGLPNIWSPSNAQRAWFDTCQCQTFTIYEFSQSPHRTEHDIPVPCLNLRCMIKVAPQHHATCWKVHSFYIVRRIQWKYICCGIIY